MKVLENSSQVSNEDEIHKPKKSGLNRDDINKLIKVVLVAKGVRISKLEAHVQLQRANGNLEKACLNWGIQEIPTISFDMNEINPVFFKDVHSLGLPK